MAITRCWGKARKLLSASTYRWATGLSLVSVRWSSLAERATVSGSGFNARVDNVVLVVLHESAETA
jgi:hypothetical protein